MGFLGWKHTLTQSSDQPHLLYPHTSSLQDCILQKSSPHNPPSTGSRLWGAQSEVELLPSALLGLTPQLSPHTHPPTHVVCTKYTKQTYKYVKGIKIYKLWRPSCLPTKSVFKMLGFKTYFIQCSSLNCSSHMIHVCMYIKQTWYMVYMNKAHI